MQKSYLVEAVIIKHGFFKSLMNAGMLGRGSYYDIQHAKNVVLGFQSQASKEYIDLCETRIKDHESDTWSNMDIMFHLPGGAPGEMNNVALTPVFVVLLYALVMRRAIHSTVAVLGGGFFDEKSVVCPCDGPGELQKALGNAGIALKGEVGIESVVAPLLGNTGNEGEERAAVQRGTLKWPKRSKLYRPKSYNVVDLLDAVLGPQG